MASDALSKEDRDAWWNRRMELLIWFGSYIHTGNTADLESGIRIAQAAAARPSGVPEQNGEVA